MTLIHTSDSADGQTFFPCSTCGADIPPVVPVKGFTDDPTEWQGENALDLRLSGGYGCFMDPMDPYYYNLILCHDCAHKFVNTFPVLLEKLRGSHSHRTDDMRDATDWKLEGEAGNHTVVYGDGQRRPA